ncbi:MAG: hypothetical protein JW384_03304 [Nitrosomonadaceae bacterium]|nr:hypothetical protein [Nitrosomonadaceae bacterium]
MQDKKKKVDHQWFLNNRAKEYLRLLEIKLARGSSDPDDELWEPVQTSSRKEHPQCDYLSFDHIPAVVREVYALKWNMHGFTRTSDDYDDELAILECIQVGGGGLIAVRERYDFVESEVKHMELYFQLNPIKRKFIRLLLILSPNHLDPDRIYLPFQEPLHYRYCF